VEAFLFDSAQILIGGLFIPNETVGIVAAVSGRISTINEFKVF
jgi:hypothetical protein